MSDTLESQVRDAWRQARERAEAAGRPVTPAGYFHVDDPPAAWAKTVERTREFLAEEHSPEVVAERFCVPADFDAFQRIDGVMWQSAAPPTWLLFNSQEVGPFCHNDVIPRRDDGLWLIIASSYDDRWLLLCCDRRHPLFGAVVVGYDHGCPYRDGVPSPKCRVAAPSFLEYLRIAEGFRPPEDLPVPPPKPEPSPVPWHLREWVAPVSFEDEILKATVRCPCGSERVELHYLGTTSPSREDGTPLPRVVKIDEDYYLIIKAVCAACRAEQVLFDKNRHGFEGFSWPPREPTVPPRPFVAWSCVSCSGLAHTAEVVIVSDYMYRYFENRYHLKYGVDRWPEMFGWIDVNIRCCGCDRRTGWISYETR